MSKPRKKKILYLFDVILLLALAVELYVSNNVLTVSEYAIEAEVEEPLRIVQLTDLHNKEFGKGNKRLVQKVQEQDPDLIFMTGDMINEDDENLDVIIGLIQSLNKIAPVYFSYGNHEKAWENTFSDNDLRGSLEKAGAIVLDDEYLDTEFHGMKVRLGGYYGYYRRSVMTTSDPDKRKEIDACYQEYEDTDRYKILLCHIPTSWMDWDDINGYPDSVKQSDYYDGNNVNLVFSGHYHGGQVRVPGLGGLYAPYVKWFPKFTKGIFEGEKTTCVLSAGLGSYGWILRAFNNPEVVSVVIG